MGPAAGLLGFGAGLSSGVPGAPSGPHASVAGGGHPLLKSAELHSRESVDIKGPGSANAEERLVSVDEGVGAIFVRVCFRIPFLRATEINTDRDRRQTWNRTWSDGKKIN
jgi:hypothetical protein